MTDSGAKSQDRSVICMAMNPCTPHRPTSMHPDSREIDSNLGLLAIRVCSARNRSHCPEAELGRHMRGRLAGGAVSKARRGERSAVVAEVGQDAGAPTPHS